MLRALAKGCLLFAFGSTTGGARLYRELTRNTMGTQATHVDKLQRVWPGYVRVWREQCCLHLNGSVVWVHEGGWTPFPYFANYLVTGQGGYVTNSEGRVLNRYLARAVNGALAITSAAGDNADARARTLEALRWCETVPAAISQIGGSEVGYERGASIALGSETIDLCHSGGALEHYQPDELRSFLAEQARILKPGGISSHVFDHRDHLYHADHGIPFLAHLAFGEAVYNLLCRHSLLYHSRLLPDEIVAEFERSGLEPIAVRRMILPDRRYVIGNEALAGVRGIDRRRLARRFQNATDADLHTAAAHYLFRKPHR